ARREYFYGSGSQEPVQKPANISTADIAPPVGALLPERQTRRSPVSVPAAAKSVPSGALSRHPDLAETGPRAQVPAGQSLGNADDLALTSPDGDQKIVLVDAVRDGETGANRATE